MMSNRWGSCPSCFYHPENVKVKNGKRQRKGKPFGRPTVQKEVSSVQHYYYDTVQTGAKYNKHHLI